MASRGRTGRGGRGGRGARRTENPPPADTELETPVPPPKRRRDSAVDSGAPAPDLTAITPTAGSQPDRPIELEASLPTANSEAQFLRRTTKLELSNFSGLPREDPHTWLAEVDFAINPTGRQSDRLPDAAALVAIKDHLQGLARHWFLDLPPAQRSTYTTWRSSFLDQYANSPFARRNAQQELLMRRQGPQEPIGDFAVAIAQLSKRADPDMGARDIVENFVSKLADAALMNLLLSRAPATLHDAVSIATEHVARTAAREATTMRSGLVAATSAAFPGTNVNSNGQRSIGPCFNCNQFGHLARECPHATGSRGTTFRGGHRQGPSRNQTYYPTRPKNS